MFWRRRIRVYADFIDPFCYLGFHYLADAVRKPWAIEWRGFELNASTPPEGMPLATAGNSEVRPAQWAAIRRLGIRAGLFLKDPDFVPNTHLAHSLVLGVQNDVKIPLIRRIYQAYFIEQSDIGSIAVLADLASSFGVSLRQSEALLRRDRTAASLNRHHREALRRGFAGLPGFVVGWSGKHFGVITEEEWRKKLCLTK